jgi:hypothetical protein
MNRNYLIAGGAAIALYFLFFKNKKPVAAEEVGGGGGGGGGGGFFPSFPIPPINGGTGTGTGTGRRTTGSDPYVDANVDPLRDSKGKPSDDIVLDEQFTYTTGFVLRPIRVRISKTGHKTYKVGDKIEIAVPKAGNNFTHPKSNPSQTLLLGTDVDFSGIVMPKGVTPPFVRGGLGTQGGLSGGAGGTTSGGTMSGGSTGGTISGGATTTTTRPRVGGIGSSYGGSTSAGSRVDPKFLGFVGSKPKYEFN